MEIKAFLIGFEKSLIANDFTPEAARHHTLKVAKALSENDKKRIASFENYEQVSELATNYAVRIRIKNKESSAKINNDTSSDTAAISGNFSKSINDNNNEVVKVYPHVNKGFKNENAEDAKTLMFTSVKTEKNVTTDSSNFKTTQIKAVKREKQTEYAFDETTNDNTKRISKVNGNKVQLSKDGKLEFNKRIAMRSPLIVFGFICAGTVAFAVYSFIAALIVMFVLLLVAVIVTGGVGTLAGFIYGIIKLFTVLPEGLYEIGFALAIAGITLALSICSYNIAVRVIPVLWRKFTDFLRSCLKKFRVYINNIRKECADI